MKYWLIVCSVFLLGCGSSGPTNVAGKAKKVDLEAYQAALDDADKMAATDKDFEK